MISSITLATSMIKPSFESDLNYWQRSSNIESGRAEVLKMVARGDDLPEILNCLCKNSEIYNPNMKTSVLKLNEATSTLHPCASVSLPKSYCDALDGVVIGMGVGSCGTATFSKKRVIVEDINTHPYWAQYKELALSAGLQSCWSEPIMGANGRCFGSFAIYYGYPNSPSDEDLHFIEACANLAAVVFENKMAQSQLLEANRLLNITIDQRNAELQLAHDELALFIEKQKQENQQQLNLEKTTTTKMLLMGLAHEINTPLGVAVTSNSFLNDLLLEIVHSLETASLTKNSLDEKLSMALKSIELTQLNLHKSSDLIAKFKEIDNQQDDENICNFDMLTFFDDLKDYVHINYPTINFKYEVNTPTTLHSKSALFKIMTQLIENSFIHGFEKERQGSISIYLTTNKSGFYFNYQDDGIGLNQAANKDIFEPFYSTKRNEGSLGLGLSIVNNTLANVFNGKIDILPSPIGVRMLLFIPAL